jgi:hypothetical protein
MCSGDAERQQETCQNDLQNRRLQVRFLSHLPLRPEFMGIAALWLRHNVCASTSI